jgi:ABC-2 type transport system permease protein
MTPSSADKVLDGPAEDALATRWMDLSALGSLFWLTLRQHSRARRLLVLLLLFAVPVAIALIARYTHSSTGPKLAFGLIFTLIPQVLVPLTALLYAAGMIQDEIEEQTLTYLLVRPLQRWAIFLSKLLATWLVACVLVGVLLCVTYLAIYVGESGVWDRLPREAAAVFLATALALGAYCSIFSCLSLFVRRTLVAGVAYILIFEGLIANIDFVVRSLTVMFYYRVLVERWLGQSIPEWKISLGKEPSVWTCVAILLGASAAAAVVGTIWFTQREFRVKTPEGS